MTKLQHLGKPLISFLFLLILVLFLIGSFLIPSYSANQIQSSSPVSLSSDWYNTQTRDSISTSTIYLHHNSEISISHIVSLMPYSDTYLCLNNPHYQITATVDDQIISSTILNPELTFGKESGCFWQIIPLSLRKSGNELTLTIQNSGPSQFFDLSDIYLGTYSQVDFLIFSKTFYNILETAIILVLSIIIFVYTYFLHYYNNRSVSRAYLWLGLLTFTTSLWLFSDSALLSVLVSNFSLLYLSHYLSFLSIPVFCLLFYKQVISTGKRILSFLLSAYCLSLIIFMFLYAFNIVHITFWVYFVQLFILACSVYLAGTTFYDYYHTRRIIILISALNLSFIWIGLLIHIFLDHSGIRVPLFLAYRHLIVIFLLTQIISSFYESLSFISDAKAAIHYRQMAYIDPITNGHSKIYFAEKIQKQSANNRYFLYINLLQFKLLNQIHGRNKCDELLRNIYDELSSSLFLNELICSMGNADFGLSIVAKDMNQIHERCFQIQNAVKDYNQSHAPKMTLKLQFSLCKIVKDSPALEELLDFALMCRNSPSASYWADVDCYIYNDACREDLLNEKNLTDHLDTALHEGELQVYLQPKVSLHTGTVETAEALARWFRPDGTMLSPGVFVPIFEKNGLIYKIDIYIFKQVCLQISDWLAQGLEPPVISVNISKIAIIYEGFFESYSEIVKKTGIPGKYLEFELTESIAYDNFDLLKTILDDIHQMGAHCSMDDFGKSHSNLTALGSLPFHTVKMDKCFFDTGFPYNKRQYQLVAGTIKLLKSLNIHIVAEGIEYKDQVNALKELQCDAIQGFYFAKPMPVSDFETTYLAQ